MEDLARACLAAAAATLCIPGKANDPGGRNPFRPAWAALFWALWAAGLGTGLLTIFNSELATLAPPSGKFGNTGDDCESLWSTELLFPVPVLVDKVFGTPNVEVVALLAACSVIKKNREIVVFYLCIFCYFDTKFSSMIFFFFFFLCITQLTLVFSVLYWKLCRRQLAADLADTPFSLLPAPHGSALVGLNSKNPPKIMIQTIREIDWLYLCLQQFDKFLNLKRNAMTGNGRYANFSKNCQHGKNREITKSSELFLAGFSYLEPLCGCTTALLKQQLR